MPFIAMGVAAVAGGVGNYLANKSAGDRAEMLQQQAMQEWISLQIPDPEQQKIALQKFVIEGKLDPKLEQAIKADPSEFKNVIASAEHQNAQNRALSEMQEIGEQGGLRLQDKAALQDAMLDQQTRDRGNRQAIEADMARRGLGGSGFDIAAQLQGQQGTSDQAAKNSLSIAAQAQERALQSIMGAGDLATKYRSQDVGEQAQRAAAADKINLFNTQNLQDVQQRNVGSLNAAAAQNLAERQRISEANTKQGNYEQEYNKKLLQQQFENQAQRTAGKTGQYQGLANTAMQQGQNLGNLYSNIGGAAANAAAVYGSRNAAGGSASGGASADALEKERLRKLAQGGY